MTRPLLLLAAALVVAALALDFLATWTLTAAGLPARLGAAAWWGLMLTLPALGLLALRRLRGRARLADGLLLVLLLTLLLLQLGLGLRAHAASAAALLLRPEKGLTAERLEAGRVLRLQGPIAAGDAERLGDAVAAAHRIELSSSGGSPGDALALAARVRPGAQLLLRGPCTRDCALLFLAAERRIALPEAYLGLQRLAAPSWMPVVQRWLDARLAPAYAALPPLLQQRLQLTPAPRLAVVEGLELETVLSRPANPLLLVLPVAPSPRGDYLLALQSHGVWPALGQRFPRLLDALADDLLALPDDAARQQHAWTLQRQLAARLRAEADAPLRLQALELVQAQVAELHAQGDEAACRALLAGDAEVHARLSAPLQGREADWLRHAARDLQRDLSPVRGAERETLLIVLGQRQLQAVTALRRGELGCTPAAALLDALMALPPAQRRSLAKVWFTAG